MEWISNWIQGIIVAVIISTIIEMILPQGNCKKYIKVVIGVYILFSIISPVITKLTGTNFNLANTFDLNEYIEASNHNTYESLNQNQENQIKEVYKTSLKKDMKEKIEKKGYSVIDISIELTDNGQYTINKLNLNLTKKLTKEDETLENTVKNIETINKVQIQVGNEQSTKEQDTKKQEQILSEQEKRELKQYIKSVYEIEEKNININ